MIIISHHHLFILVLFTENLKVAASYFKPTVAVAKNSELKQAKRLELNHWSVLFKAAVGRRFLLEMKMYDFTIIQSVFSTLNSTLFVLF